MSDVSIGLSFVYIFVFLYFRCINRTEHAVISVLCFCM